MSNLEGTTETIPETTKKIEESTTERVISILGGNWFTLKPNWLTLQSGNVETPSVSGYLFDFMVASFVHRK